jgi:hypothetical protein
MNKFCNLHNRIQEKLIHFLVIIPLKEYQTYNKHDKVHNIILILISHVFLFNLLNTYFGGPRNEG